MRRTIGLFLGPVIFVFFIVAPVPETMSREAMYTAGIALLMATWWLTEAIPIPVTALLPLVLFPTLGVATIADVSANYGNHIIFLFMGGLFIAKAVEKWQLHNRIALHTIRLVGITPGRIVLGFMLVTAFLSMWVSNTATCMMMVTIAMAVLKQNNNQVKHTGTNQASHAMFATALMLSIAYAASIGGVATLIGTPPNAILAGIVEQQYGFTISFVDWLMFGLPLSIVMLALAWFYLTKLAYPDIDNGVDLELAGGMKAIEQEIKKLGVMSTQEKRVLFVFVSVALAWIVRGLVEIDALKMIKDSTIAIAGAIALFIIPAGSNPASVNKKEFLLDWKTAVTIPWDILILFGGGFALAHVVASSGLTPWIGQALSVLQGSKLVIVLLAVVTIMVFLTEITSNTATATLLVPVMGALASALESHPLGLMAAAAVAASFAFMLPVATPPNAIVFSSRQISIPQMARAGIWLNLAGIVVITIFVMFLLPVIWGIDIHQLPELNQSSPAKF